MSGDGELLSAWRAGDRSAGSALFERHFDGVRRFFRNKVDHGVEDLVQRTFVACVEGRDRFREQASFRTYLFAIAHNILCDQLRGQRRPTAELDLERLSVVDLGASPHSILAARGEERLLLHALRQVPFATQVILELYYWEHLTGAELGVFLGVPEDTARSRLRKARQVLESTVRRIETDHRRLESTVSNLDAWAERVRGQLTPTR